MFGFDTLHPSVILKLSKFRCTSHHNKIPGRVHYPNEIFLIKSFEGRAATSLWQTKLDWLTLHKLTDLKKTNVEQASIFWDSENAMLLKNKLLQKSNLMLYVVCWLWIYSPQISILTCLEHPPKQAQVLIALQKVTVITLHAPLPLN